MAALGFAALLWLGFAARANRLRAWAGYWFRKGLFILRRRRDKGEVELPWPTPGSLLRGGRYTIQEQIGAGGFSRVHRVSECSTGTLFAVKVILLRAGSGTWLRDRFAHEIAAMHSLRVAGAMPVLDSWVEPDGMGCIMMPLIEGPTLREWSANLSSEERLSRAYRVLARLAATLRDIHLAGFVHRDLKPGNILMMETEGRGAEPLIADFGSAVARSASMEMDRTLHPAGSLGYMAPEQLRGQYNFTTDLYAFGLIAFELVAGVQHWRAIDDPSRTAWWLSTYVSGLDPTVATLIAQAIRPAVAERPADPKAWLEEFELACDRGARNCRDLTAPH